MYLAREPTLNVTAYNGPMRINVPLVEEGEALSQTDARGCLIQAGFARGARHRRGRPGERQALGPGVQLRRAGRGLQPGVHLRDRRRIPQPRAVRLHPHQHLRHAEPAPDAGAGEPFRGRGRPGGGEGHRGGRCPRRWWSTGGRIRAPRAPRATPRCFPT